eukprot:m.647146 g.647146  ORF g.647146 m.647146 type:complete len:811 (-) comp22654_c1_seq1:955-3387(-)
MSFATMQRAGVLGRCAVNAGGCLTARLSLPCIQSRNTRPQQEPVRHYNFASTPYVGCFGDLPPVDMTQIRKDTIAYISAFDKELWFNQPVFTVLKGRVITEGEKVETTDAFENVVGNMVLAPPEVVDQVIEHIKTYASPAGNDLREKMRRVEARMLSVHAAALVGNQAMDFKKQDGVTEIEESLEANEVERRLNDLLFQDELDGKLSISRRPALVGCVSNFSNFLDLCRKCLRNLELGVPVVVLSRSNTTQHMYRWVELLLAEMEREGVDTGMVTYAACSIDEQRRIMAAAEGSPLYLTGSRPVAKAIKELVPATFSSTGGPNTMVTTKISKEVAQAIRWSVAIENSGQCTAMRHLVAPHCDGHVVKRLFDHDSLDFIDGPEDSLQRSGFAGVYRAWGDKFDPAAGYDLTATGVPVAYTVNDKFPTAIDEGWRRMYLDVTQTASEADLTNPEFTSELSRWLVREQPITLAINADDAAAGYPLAMQLFEQTCQVVYSIGTTTTPALTCQARPQEAEVFGEFAPRKELTTYTKFPVIVPSSTPGYHSAYTEAFLATQGNTACAHATAAAVLDKVTDVHVRGYLKTVADYLVDACGPKRGYGARTTLWGLQRPPINGTVTELRVSDTTSLDSALMYALPFVMTNAAEQLAVSCAAGSDCTAPLRDLGVTVREETDEAFAARVAEENPWNVVHPGPATEFPLAMHFISLIFPLGHIKSVLSVRAYPDPTQWQARWELSRGNILFLLVPLLVAWQVSLRMLGTIHCVRRKSFVERPTCTTHARAGHDPCAVARMWVVLVYLNHSDRIVRCNLSVA